MAYAANWGAYVAVDEIAIDYTKLSTTARTFYPLSKHYVVVTIGIQPNVTFNPVAAEKKFVISLAGASTDTLLDFAFFDNGVIDIVLTTQNTATKIADTGSARWTEFQFIIIEVSEKKLKLRAAMEHCWHRLLKQSFLIAFNRLARAGQRMHSCLVQSTLQFSLIHTNQSRRQRLQ
ncbi:MAG: hypothetical protein QXM12_06385 [Nitrososphaerota archaeon]